MKGVKMNGNESQDSPEPIAIVGMGCRFPGDASSPSKLWELLEAGKSAQSDVPKNRFNVDSWYHPDSSRPGSVSARGGYFLGHDESFRQFDPSFFGINPLEAASVDPQQRKLLEVVYECFESSGTTLERLSGSKTACYVGCFTRDFAQMTTYETEYGAPYQMTGSDMTILSNRINYVFDLKGPSMTLDTACSSSLYALHLACQSIRIGDCEAAVVGGTNIIFGINQHISSVRLGVLSPTSTCHTFDESADGFGRGEGIGAIYIKKLSTAIADGDPIRAIIRATAINSNGRSQGINHPSSEEQEAVIREAYGKAGLKFDKTGYFECHGTGTRVGDPIEVAAIGNVFASGRTVDDPLFIGSVKPNLGHTEGASGLASVMKVVLSLEQNCIPATIGVNKLNPEIDFREGRLQVVRSNTPWPNNFVRRASINSFGYGGANAHCVIDAADLHTKSAEDVQINGFTNGRLAIDDPSKSIGRHSNGEEPNTEKKYLLIFSAHDEITLKRNIEAISERAIDHSIRDIAYTLGVRRSKLYNRAFSISTEHIVESQLANRNITYGCTFNGEPVIAFVFTGQGAQYPRMGYSLIQQYPSVRKTFEQLQLALDKLPTPPMWCLKDALAESAKSSRVQEAALSQPLCTAVQIAITILLQSWRIHPIAVVGHSSGEVAAAFCSGLLTATEAITVAYYRGISVAQCHIPGAMMAVGVGAVEVRPYVEHQPDVVIACQNAPNSVTLSGRELAIDEIEEALIKDGIFSRKLKTSRNAYHSHLVRKAGQYYQDCFEESLPALVHMTRKSEIPMYSCITGEVLNSQHNVGIDYWRRNLESPVLFDQAVRKLITSHRQVTHLVEIGPHSALAGPIRQIRSALKIDPEQLNYLPSLVRGEDGVCALLKLAGSLFTNGYPIDMESINSTETKDLSTSRVTQHVKGKLLFNLPSYQWNYGVIPLVENRFSHELMFRTHARHDLLGSRHPGSSLGCPVWRNKLQLKNVPWLKDHKIGDDIIFPAAGYVAMAIESATQVMENRGFAPQGYTFQRLHIKSPLILPTEEAVETLFNLRVIHDVSSKEVTKWFDFRVSSVTTGGNWTEHAMGMVGVEEVKPRKAASNLDLEGHRGANSKDTSDRKWYAALAKVGLEYGPTFRTLSNVQTTSEENKAIASINMAPTKGVMLEESRYMIHPATLDGCLQLSIIAAQKHNTKNIVKAYLPTVIDKLTVWRGPLSKPLPDTTLVRGNGICQGLRSAHASSDVFGEDGELLAETKVSFYSLEGSFSKQMNDKPRQPYLRLIWQPDIDRLKGEPIRGLFPSGTSDPLWRSLSNQLDEISKLCVLDSVQRIPNEFDFDMEARSPYVRRFARWLQIEGQKLAADTSLGMMPSHTRQERIKALVMALTPHVPEAQMIVRLSESMPEILSGKIGASDVMFADGQLNHIYEHGFINKAAYQQLIKVVKLIAHKDPGLRVLEIGAGTGGTTRPMLQALQGNSWMPRYTQYTFTDASTAFLDTAQEKFKEYLNIEYRPLNIALNPLEQGFGAESYDLIVASNINHTTGHISTILKHCRDLLKPQGRIVVVETTTDRLATSFMFGTFPYFWQPEEDLHSSALSLPKASWNNCLLEAGFSGNDIVLDDYGGSEASTSIIVSTVKQEDSDLLPNLVPPLWLVYRNRPHRLFREIESLAEAHGIHTHCISLAAVQGQVPTAARVLMLAELEGPLLSNMLENEMAAVRSLVKTAFSTLWVTNGGLLTGKQPEQSLLFGIAKSIMTEQPSFQLSSIDLDPDEKNHTRSAKLIVEQELALRNNMSGCLATELVEKDGIVYISRYIVDDVENRSFSRLLNPCPEKLELRGGLALDFLQVGQVDSYYFKQKKSAGMPLQSGQVLLSSRAFSLSRMEASILKGQHDSESFSHECLALISHVGPNVSRLKPGDRVICLAPGKFDSTFVANQVTCELLRQDEDTESMVGMLFPFCAALHALQILGHVEKGETVLIHAVTGPTHIAAILVAQLLGCKVIATFNTESEMSRQRGVYETLKNCTLYIVAAGLASRITASTGGHGVDVVLATPGTPDLQSIWTCLAKNGRFVFMGDSDVPDLGLFDVSIFAKGASFTSFDFMNMISTEVEETARLMRRVLGLLRDKSLSMLIPCQRFGIAELPSAIGVAARPETFSNVVVTCGPLSIVPIHLAQPPLIFSSAATYLLIGCLGGLGRSLTSWMTGRGARHFVFLSRSGADKPEAAGLVQELHQLASFGKEDMTVQVVRGDVSNREDIDRAIGMAMTPIRGVIQAAMFLQDEIFTNMSLKTFNAVLSPKVRGTINLHEALLHEPLDFFVMTSSVIGAIGASTQSNYAAANAFMDSMARHRYSLGLQGTSIALGMVVEVGHVEAHPEVEEALRRNGIYGIDEDEYLRMMELACRPRKFGPAAWDWDEWAQAHIVTGMEPGRLSKAAGKTLWLEDKRMRNIALALGVSDNDTQSTATTSTQTAAVLAAAAKQNGELGVKNAMCKMVLQKFSKLVLVPVEKLTASLARPLAEFGMDSMISAEVRTWAWRELKADLPFMSLLESGRRVEGLVNLIWERMDPGLKNGVLAES